MTPSRNSKTRPTWVDVKAKLADFDRAKLLGVIADLYGASHENQAFLHARFSVGKDPLKPYKAAISRWIYPDAYGHQRESVTKAKKAISQYRKAVGTPDGLVELMTFYCEQASTFCADVGMDDEDFYGALVGVFKRALKTSATLEASARTPFLERLEAVRLRCHGFGYCVGDQMDDLWRRCV